MTRALLGVLLVLGLGPIAAGRTSDGFAIERPFAEGGTVRLLLASGDYAVRAGAADRIAVRWEADDEARVKDLRKLTADIRVMGTAATIVTEGKTTHIRFRIEVPARSDLNLRVRAGEITIDGIEGHKDVRMTAGELRIGVRPDSLSSTRASVTFGDIDARALGISKSGIKRSLNWAGDGAYTLDARLFAGDLVLAHQR